jgi:branched-chain amino acid transport system substrate-binding protein
MHILNSVSSSIGGVLRPAGYDTAQGVVSVTYYKDVTDPQWKDDPGVKEYDAFLQKWYPDADRKDSGAVVGMMAAQTLVKVLEQCGDELTRENVMKQAANLKDLELGLMLPGVKLNTSPSDFFPIEQEQMMRFQNEGWVRFGDVITGEVRE